MSSQALSVANRRKRGQPVVSSGIPGSYDDKDSSFACPVCFNTIEEAYITKCGHSFCYGCIRQSLEHNCRCPKCNFVIEKKDDIFPNFMLNEAIIKQKSKADEQKRLKLDKLGDVGDVVDVETLEQGGLDLTHVNHLLSVLSRKKQLLEQDCTTAQNKLLKEFLERILIRKQEELHRVSVDLQLVRNDLDAVALVWARSRALCCRAKLTRRPRANL